MPLTLRQIVDQIKAVANAHAQIDGVGVGDFAELQSQTREYPLFWIFHERSDIAEGYIIRRIRLLCADRVQTGQEGDDDDGMEIEVLSDTQRILMDFIAYFAQQHNQAYIVDRVGSIDPFTERFDDRVAGNTALLTFKEPWDYSKCETPISTVTFPPTVDGLTLYDFGDASVLGRLTAQQVADLQAAYGAVCADATITINGDSYGTVPAGGTENIIVESENNNPLGSLVGGNWEVGNAHLRVNGTTVGNLEPEQWHDHYATINGTQAGAWHNPSQTWRMTVLQGGVQVGSLSGTDWVVPVCADATAVLKNTDNTTLSTTSIASGASQNITAPDATAVLKNTANTTLLTEAIPSNVSENITAPDATITLNGSAYGLAPSGATFNVTTTPPSLSVATSSATPTFLASVTLTATPTNITPTGYTWYANGDQIGTGNGLVWAVDILGSITITCVATDGTLIARGSTTITSTYVRRTSIYTDGVNDFVRGWWNIGSAGGRALTASFYLKYISGSAFFIQIGDQTDGQNYVFLVQPSSTGPAFNFRIGAATGSYMASQAVTANVWYHIIMTYRVSGWSTANPMAIYINGTSIYSNASPTGLLQLVKPSVQLGLPLFGGAASVKFHGLSLFEDCISAAQATTLYNGGTPLNDPTLSGVDRSEWFGGLETAQVPSTNTALPYTKVVGVNGGVLNCNNNYASPYGLVTDIP